MPSHVLAVADVVLPAVEDRAGDHPPAGFLAELASHADTRILAELELAARQLPLSTLVAQQQDQAGLHRHPFDRNGECARIARARDEISPGLPEELLLLAMAGWLHLFGTISFELFGQLNNVIEARAEFFDQQMSLMADLMGI